MRLTEAADKLGDGGDRNDMGLDFFDLQLRLERTFRIRFAKEEQYFFESPGRIHRLVCHRLQGCQPLVPDFRRWGGEVWKAATGALERSRWLPLWSYYLERIIPADRRRQVWQEMSRRLGLTLPALDERPDDPVPRFPADCDTLYRLILWVGEQYPDHFPPLRPASYGPAPPGGADWTEEAIWIGVRNAIVEVANVKPEQVTPHAHMKEDLGME
jgi:hypothetical protein